MNVTAYIIYLFITYLITVHVGLVFYRNGRVFILNLLKGDERLTDFINRILLTGYYLLNLGYAALTIHLWETVTTWIEVLISIAIMTGKIMLLLGIIHFFNMLAIFLISKSKQHSLHHKT
jgi:hypothetical protein